MKSARPKVVHELGGLPHRARLRTVDRLAAASTTLVIGHGADDVRAVLKGGRAAVCRPVAAARHWAALRQAEPVLAGNRERPAALRRALLESNTLTRSPNAPRGAGRRDGADRIARRSVWAWPNRERRGRAVDAYRGGTRRLGRRTRIREINSGITPSRSSRCSRARRLATDNAQGEHYLTDLIAGTA
jgi:hypothetical protein